MKSPSLVIKDQSVDNPDSQIDSSDAMTPTAFQTTKEDETIKMKGGWIVYMNDDDRNKA